MKQHKHILATIASAWLAVSFILAPVKPAAAMPNPFFIGQQLGFHDLSPFTKWTSLMPRYEEQRKTAEANCDTDYCPARQWEALLQYLKGKPVKEQIAAVNDFFNAMAYISDEDNWGTDDYWATPYELMTRGGDCEDYAIAKYISLKRLGVPESKMRVIIVQDANLNGTMHALLEVKIKNTAYILDNQAKDVKMEAEVFHYQPVYAINENHWWAYQS